MIDTHAHLDFADFDEDRTEVLRRFFAEGGKAIINIGVNKERNAKVVQLTKENEKLFSVIGFHPEEVGKVAIEEAIASLEKHLINKKKNKIVAIGEIGLDYFHNQENKPEQKALLQAQLELAQKYNLPAVIHCRDAYDDFCEMLSSDSRLQTAKVVMHCYMGNQKQTEKFLQFPNLRFSFTGNITFSDFEKYKNGTLSAEKSEIFKVIEQISLEKIMTETDSPFLAPAPHRGKRNEPVFVKEVVMRLAEIKNLSLEAVEFQTEQNAAEFFGIRI